MQLNAFHTTGSSPGRAKESTTVTPVPRPESRRVWSTTQSGARTRLIASPAIVTYLSLAGVQPIESRPHLNRNGRALWSYRLTAELQKLLDAYTTTHQAFILARERAQDAQQHHDQVAGRTMPRGRPMIDAARDADVAKAEARS
jgi:hypothetical protein